MDIKEKMQYEVVLTAKGRPEDVVIISAFPGTGKTYHRDNHPYSVIDSDSSSFSWNEDGNRNPDFPQNYIRNIKEEMYCDKTFIIFVSSHKVVRDALVDEGIHFLLVFPERDLKEEYLERFRSRGNKDAFVDLLEKNWDVWMDEMEAQTGCEIARLSSGKFLSDFLLDGDRIDEAIKNNRSR